MKVSRYYDPKIGFYHSVLNLVIKKGPIRLCCHVGYLSFLKILSDLILSDWITVACFTHVLHFIHCFSHLIDFTRHYLLTLHRLISFLKRLIYSAIFTDHLYLRIPYFCLELNDCCLGNHFFPTMQAILQI